MKHKTFMNLWHNQKYPVMAGRLLETKHRTCMRGYHVYQNDWMPVLCEVLHCSCEISNVHNPFAIKVTKDGNIVGHLPKKISSTCSLFIRKRGIIYCEVTDPHRRYSWDLVQGV